MKQAILKLFGEVQGVGMRYWINQIARELNLTGWVKNEPDGTVSILAQGREEDLNKLILFIKNKIDFTKIERLEEQRDEVKDQIRNFNIRFD